MKLNRWNGVVDDLLARVLMEPDKGGKSGGSDDDDDKKPKGKADDKGKKKDGADDQGAGDGKPVKIELTDEELQERLKLERVRWEKEQADKQKKEQEDADRKKKKEDGDLQGLLDSESARAKELETQVETLKRENKQLRVNGMIRDYIAANHAEYSNSIKYIEKAVEFDDTTADDEIGKRIKSAVDEFVKENPRQAASDDKKKSNGTGTPPAPRGKGGDDSAVSDARKQHDEAKKNRMIEQSRAYARNF